MLINYIPYNRTLINRREMRSNRRKVGRPDKGTLKKVILLFCSIFSIFVLATFGCNSDKEMIEAKTSDSAESPDTKLDSALSQLISADLRGKASEFATQANIKLFDNKVRVIVESVTGRIEEAYKVVSATGAEIETSYNDLLQVLVPIKIINNLADEGCIRIIRLPQQSLPATALNK